MASTTKSRILVQLDVDATPSVFDAVVALDAGAEHLISIGEVTPESVVNHVYGAIFTRGQADLAATALFVGGSNVRAAEAVLESITKTFFGPFRVSVLLDANGCNTTAAAAVLAAREAFDNDLRDVPAAVLGGTGPVGQRVARLLARAGARVSVGSRILDRAEQTSRTISESVGRPITGFWQQSEGLADSLADRALVVAAGAAGVTLLDEPTWKGLDSLKVLIDLNAVPPAGIAGIDPPDQRRDLGGGMIGWGAIGVGGIKMRIHHAAVAQLFRQADRVFDAEEVFELALSLDQPGKRLV